MRQLSFHDGEMLDYIFVGYNAVFKIYAGYTFTLVQNVGKLVQEHTDTASRPRKIQSEYSIHLATPFH
jgi:hypothetical protein